MGWWEDLPTVRLASVLPMGGGTMTSEGDYEKALKDAERDLSRAQTADEVRSVWKRYYLVVGHRTLGRLLMGRSAAELAARRQAKSD